MTHLTLPQLGRRTPVTAEQTILQAALAAGVAYPHGCRSGRCGSCKSRLISGDVELGKHSRFALTEEDRANGLILACRSVPTTNVTVAWLDVDYVTMPTVAQGATVGMVKSHPRHPAKTGRSFRLPFRCRAISVARHAGSTRPPLLDGEPAR
jgi:ferredoxin